MNLSEKLPEEILLKEILVKLPRNSLRSSSSVCKPLHDLVTRNYFSEKHNSESKKIKNADTRVFLGWTDFKNNKLEQKYSIISNNQPFQRPVLEPFHIPKTKTLAGSCNGIICLAPVGENVVLYNPITQQHRVLPPGFLGDPCNKIHYRFQLIGFGFDESTNDYKVVRICFDHSKSNRYAEIYRLSANCWRKIECENIPILDYITFHHHPNGVFLNGVVHWVVDPYFKIFTFDFESEVFGEIECVNPGSKKHVCNCVTTLDDSIAFVSTTKRARDTFLDVWVMKEYGNEKSWTKKFSVQLPYCQFQGSVSIVATACWVSNENQLVVLRSNGQLVIFPGNGKPARILLEIDPYFRNGVNGVVFQPRSTSFLSGS